MPPSTAENRFDAIVTSIYDAALDNDSWPHALALVSRELDASASGLSHFSYATGSFSQTWHDLEPAFEKAYVEHYWQSDPWVARGQALEVGAALFSGGLLAHRELQMTEFYNELCRPFDMQDLVGGVIARTKDQLVSFGVMRRTHPSEFREEDARFVERVIPHLQRAHHVQTRLRCSESHARSSWSAIEALPIAIFLIDRRGEIHRSNSAGDRLLRAKSGVYSEGKKLRAFAPRADQTLRALLAKRTGGPPRALERSGCRPLVASAIPLSPHGNLQEGDPAATLLVLVDPEQDPTQPSELLELVYGLTPAESRVALLVGSGLAPKEAAQIIGSTWNTVRAQLKIVFAKTSTNGQSALVRLVSKLDSLPRSQ